MTTSKRAGAKVAALAGATLWLATAAAQQGDPTAARRAIVSDLAAPGIDRGLRNDDPRPARTADAVVERTGSGGAPYLRGSLIVKFRAGTTLEAQQAMLASIQGRA